MSAHSSPGKKKSPDSKLSPTGYTAEALEALTKAVTPAKKGGGVSINK